MRRRVLFKNLWRYLLPGFIMFWIVYHLNAMMTMNIINLVFQGAVGVAIYVVGVIILRAPIIKLAKEILRK